MSTSPSSPGSAPSGISPDALDAPSELRHADPIDGLVHAAVIDRPLEEVIQLITLLEQSPAHARTALEALRTAGLDRSVDDVGRLVALLAAPPRSPDGADEAIHAAVESRPVEDVTRLMALLHRAPVDSHCAQEAVRTVAAQRPVEELVQLIGQLADERKAGHGPGAEAPDRTWRAAPLSRREDDDPTPQRPGRRDHGATHGQIARPIRARRESRPAETTTLPTWPRRLTAAALLVCGVAYGPQHREGASLGVYSFAVGVFALCVVLAVAVFLRGAVTLLVAAVLLPATLATLQLLESRLHSTAVSRLLEIGVAPPLATGLAAVIATLVALTALVSALTADRSGRLPSPRPLANADRAAD